MRRVSLLNSCVLICFRPNNSTFTTHITVLYLFRSRHRHNSCIQFVSLRRVQPTYIFVHSEVKPKYLMPLYSVSTAFNITKFYGATSQMCDNIPERYAPQHRRLGAYLLRVLSIWITRTDRSSLHVARCRSMVPSATFLSLQARTRTWSTGDSLD